MTSSSSRSSLRVRSDRASKFSMLCELRQLDQKDPPGNIMEGRDYAMVPVGAFASRFLSKHGYVEGRGLGKDPKGEVPIYFNDRARARRQGLGVDRDEGRKRKRIGLGTKVRVSDGLHKGLVGFVQRAEDDYVLVEVAGSSQTFKVPTTDIDLFTENEPTEQPSRHSVKLLQWVLPGLQVRVISKKLHEGRLYNCKVLVHDVLDDSSFSVLGPDDRLLDDLKESHIETTIPPLNSAVKVLSPPHRGAMARLIERQRKLNKVTVQLMEAPFGVLELSQDEVCALHESAMG